MHKRATALFSTQAIAPPALPDTKKEGYQDSQWRTAWTPESLRTSSQRARCSGVRGTQECDSCFLRHCSRQTAVNMTDNINWLSCGLCKGERQKASPKNLWLGELTQKFRQWRCPKARETQSSRILPSLHKRPWVRPMSSSDPQCPHSWTSANRICLMELLQRTKPWQHSNE